MFRTVKFLFVVFITLSLFACASSSQGSKRTTKQQANSHYKLAMAHLQAKNPTMALKELLTAEMQDPENSEILVALAQTYQQKKAYSLAEEKYLKAVKLSKGDPRYQNNLAALYLDTQQWDKAIHYFDLASKNLLFVKAHVAIAGKAYAYYKKMDYKRALDYASEAISLAPNYAKAYLLKSQIYKAMGESAQEKFFLQRTVDVAPYFIGARYQLAELFLRENALDKAREQLQIIVDYSPTSEVGRNAEVLLKSISH
jgi:Tfp pilus assembly protein PilF